MIYARRFTTKRETVNKFGRMGYVPYVEYFMTESEEFFNEANKRKQKPFKQVEYSLDFHNIEADKIYSEKTSWERLKVGR